MKRITVFVGLLLSVLLFHGCGPTPKVEYYGTGVFNRNGKTVCWAAQDGKRCFAVVMGGSGSYTNHAKITGTVWVMRSAIEIGNKKKVVVTAKANQMTGSFTGPTINGKTHMVLDTECIFLGENGEFLETGILPKDLVEPLKQAIAKSCPKK